MESSRKLSRFTFPIIAMCMVIARFPYRTGSSLRLVGAGVGAATGSVSNVTLNGLNNLISGQNFWSGWQKSAISGAIGGGIAGGVAGGITGYQLAREGGKNMWWGGDVKHGRTRWSLFTSEKPYETVRWDINNVGSRNLNDCVPTSFAEVDDFLGGNTTYNEYKGLTNYREDVGVLAPNSADGYGRVVARHFTGNEIDHNLLSAPQNAIDLRDAGRIVHTNMPHSAIRHADNLRSIKYYHSGKIVLQYRIGSFRLNSVNNNWWFYVLNGIR